MLIAGKRIICIAIVNEKAITTIHFILISYNFTLTIANNIYERVFSKRVSCSASKSY